MGTRSSPKRARRDRAAAICVGAVVTLAAGTVGCGGGALHQATLARDCGPGGTDCQLAGLDAPLAVGASTRPLLLSTMSGSASPQLRLVSAREDRIEASGSVLHAKQPGVSAILLATPDGTVVDYLHVWAVAPTRIELHGMTEAGTRLGALADAVELEVGESFYVEPRAYADAQPLLGELDAGWTVEPPVAAVLKAGRPGLRRLRARAPGESVVTVQALGQEARLRLVVHEPTRAASGPPAAVAEAPPPPPLPDAPEEKAAPPQPSAPPRATPSGPPKDVILNPWGPRPPAPSGKSTSPSRPSPTAKPPPQPSSGSGVIDPFRRPAPGKEVTP